MNDVMDRNRVLLTHFDSYSTALVFAKWPATFLCSSPLPPGTSLVAPPATIGPEHEAEAVKAAVVSQLGLNPAELHLATDFQQWAQTDTGLVRVHLLRFTMFDAPKAALEPHGAVFKPISELRGSAPIELALAREVFNLIIGAGGGRA